MQDTMLFAALILIILGLFSALIQANFEMAQVKLQLRKYDTLISKEEFEQQLDLNIGLKQNEVAELDKQLELFKYQIQTLEHKSRKLEAKLYLQSIDAYEVQYDFINSEDYVIQLKNIKSQQNEMRQKKRAFASYKEVIIDGNKKEGDKMKKDLLKLIEIAFETQFDYAFKDVKYSNIYDIKKKINDTFEKINSLSTKTGCYISQAYLDLKLKQLDLKYELEQIRQNEKEKLQELKKESDKSKKVEKARFLAEEAEEKEKLHQQELEKLQKEMEQIEQSEAEKIKNLEHEIQQLQYLVAQDKREKEKAIADSKQLKQGIVYVISNIGSFGRDVYRICMTQSEEPERYINNMNPSAPFKFDIHFKIFSEDVSDTIEKLHKCFADRRVNIVNERKEFFKVSMPDIEAAVQAIRKETGVLSIIDFDPVAHAYEYNQTLFARKKRQNLNNEKLCIEEDGIT